MSVGSNMGGDGQVAAADEAIHQSIIMAKDGHDIKENKYQYETSTKIAKSWHQNKRVSKAANNLRRIKNGRQRNGGVINIRNGEKHHVENISAI